MLSISGGARCDEADTTYLHQRFLLGFSLNHVGKGSLAGSQGLQMECGRMIDCSRAIVKTDDKWSRIMPLRVFVEFEYTIECNNTASARSRLWPFDVPDPRKDVVSMSAVQIAKDCTVI